MTKNSNTAPPTTEVVVRPDAGSGDSGSAVAVLAYDPADLRALIEEVYGCVPKPQDFDRIKQPADGTTHFTISTPAGEQHPRTLTVVLIDAQDKRAYWSHRFSGEGVPPDCKSSDGVRGEGDPGGVCRECPHFHFQDDGGAPACRESMDLVHLGINQEQPTILDVHKMSVLTVKKYLRGLRKWRLVPHGVVTELGLAATKYRNGFAYTRLTLRTVSVLSPTERDRMRVAATAFGFDVFEAALDDADGSAVTDTVDVVAPDPDVPF